MIALLAVATLFGAQPQAELTPQQMGRAAYLAGACASYGWVGNREGIVAAAQSYVAAHPEQPETQIEAGIAEGIETGRNEMAAITGAPRSPGAKAAYQRAIRGVCDGVVRQAPTFLGRNADTDRRFEAVLSEMFGGGGATR